MSIKPPIKCPPDYSILAFRLIECKKAGIVKGITTQMFVDLQDMFVPVTNYEERQIMLKAGQTKKIDVSSIGEHWPLQEKFQFVVDPTKCGPLSEHTYSLYDESLTLIESFSFMVPNGGTFLAAFQTALAATAQIRTLISFELTTFADDGLINATALSRDIKYRHVFEFDTTGIGGYYPFPYAHPGNLITPKEKYKYPRVKIMMIYPDYYKTNILSGCNCIDASGDMKSNKKWIEYAYEDQYQAILNPSTPITAAPLLTAPPTGTQWTWNQSSTDHIGYHFKVGDMVAASSSTQPLLRGYITDIQGYFVQVDTTIGDYASNDQSFTHVYSPNEIKWRKMGDFYVHTTAQDVLDTDYLYIETLWLRNPHQYDLPVKILLAS